MGPRSGRDTETWCPLLPSPDMNGDVRSPDHGVPGTVIGHLAYTPSPVIMLRMRKLRPTDMKCVASGHCQKVAGLGFQPRLLE